MRQFEFCAVCQEFTACYRYKKEWLCDNCPKSAIDFKNDEPVEIVTVIVKPKKVYLKEKEEKKQKIKPEKAPKIKVEKPPKQQPRKKYRLSCRDALMKFFYNNPDKVFKSKEIWAEITDFEVSNIKNTLSRLVKEGFIFSRKINISGRNVYGIYSKQEILVKDYLDEESSKKLVDYIAENHPVTTKKLSEIFPISGEAITKKLKRVSSIEIFQYMNRNFYFPVQEREKCLKMIIENTSWKNQWTI
jgi:DNA-binding PadR family transcriptional regulator